MTGQTGDVFELKPHHVAINVADIDASVKWYSDILGFSVTNRNFIPNSIFKSALLKKGDFYLELFQHEKILPRPVESNVSYAGPETIGFRQIAFTVSDPQKLTEILKKKGVEITRERPDGTAQFIHDNSGNVLEFMPPNWLPPSRGSVV